MIKLFSIPTTNKPDVQEIVLLCGKEYSVGRKQQDISLAKDTSISRNHATVQVDHPMANVTNASLPPSLVITDLGSKFGTFMNDGIEYNQPVSMREPNTLTNGDRFRFGLGPNIFRIQYTPLITTSSCLKTTTPVKKNICALGGHLVPEWTDKCDYLVMDTLTLTVKVVCALLSAKHIVTPAYFEDFHNAVKSKAAKIPKPEDYMPRLAETSLPAGVSFSPDESRTTLFRGKTFLFVSTRQSKKIGFAIKCGGGAVDLITNVSPIVIKSADTIIVAPQDETIAGGPCANAVETYEKTKKRLVQESEIGLAAVFNRIDKNCNPFFSFAKTNVLPHMASQTQQTTSGGDAHLHVEDSEAQSQQQLHRTIFTQSQPDVSRVEESVAESVPNTSKRPGSKEAVAGGTRVKREREQSKDNEDDDEDIETSVTGKSGQNKEDSSSAPGSKRRLGPAEVRNVEPIAKKGRQGLCLTSRSPTASQRSTRSTSSKVLSSIFNMSDSDEDEVENEVHAEVIVPDSQISSQRLTRSQAFKSPEKLVIPDSQASPQKRRSPSKRLSPTKQSPEPNRSRNQPSNENENNVEQVDISAAANNVALELNVSLIEEPEDEAVSTNKRKRAEVSDGTIMPPPTTPAKKIKRALSDMERTPTTNRNYGIWNETSLSNKLAIKKGDGMPDNSQEIKPVPVLFKSLLAKRNIAPQLEKAGDNKTVKNFKVFKKVVPLTPTSTNCVITNSDRGTNTTKRTTGTTTTARSTITFQRYVACPTEPLVVETRVHRTTASQESVPDFSFD